MTQKRISSSISRAALISIVLLYMMPAMVFAQKKPIDKTPTEKADTIALFRNIAVSADVVGLAQLAFSDYGQYEAAMRLNLRDKYFPVVEIGYGKANAEDVATKLSYKTSAPYGRIGLDFNIAKNKHDDYRIYGGFRYALTYYKFDILGHDLTDPVWGDKVDFEAHDVKANYHWIEGVFGVDAKIAGPLRLGWSFRYRRHLFGNNGTMGNTWYVPGYGKQGGTRMGGSFNVTFEL